MSGGYPHGSRASQEKDCSCDDHESVNQAVDPKLTSEQAVLAVVQKCLREVYNYKSLVRLAIPPIGVSDSQIQMVVT